MSCTLSKFSTYDLGQVRHDRSTGEYSAQIVHPNSNTCPGGVFKSKKSKLIVSEGMTPTLKYSLKEHRPIITVPNSAYVIEYGSSFGLFDALLIGGALVLSVILLRKLYQYMTSTSVNYTDKDYAYQSGGGATNYSGRGRAVVPGNRYSAPRYAHPSGGGSTTIINNGNSTNNNLVDAILLEEILHSHDHDTVTHETLVERDHYIDHERTDDSYSSDGGSSDDSYSSDSSSSDDSYSSDSSSSDSYSSDSGSSSGSDFGSDS